MNEVISQNNLFCSHQNLEAFEHVLFISQELEYFPNGNDVRVVLLLQFIQELKIWLSNLVTSKEGLDSLIHALPRVLLRGLELLADLLYFPSQPEIVVVLAEGTKHPNKLCTVVTFKMLIEKHAFWLRENTVLLSNLKHLHQMRLFSAVN